MFGSLRGVKRPANFEQKRKVKSTRIHDVGEMPYPANREYMAQAIHLFLPKKS
jgi:hypothetical protein